MCVCAHAFRIVTWDKILCFKNTLLLLFYVLLVYFSSDLFDYDLRIFVVVVVVV